MAILKYKLNGEWIELGGTSGGNTVEVDPSLSVEGMAADAKATGEAIAGLGQTLGEAVGAAVTQEQLSETLTPIVETMALKQNKVLFNATQPTNWQNGDIWLKPAE